MTKKKAEAHDHQTCMATIRAVADALEILNGKWKLPILISLLAGKKRFKQIAKEVNGITDKMLSKELKDLEVNQLVKREVYDSFPPAVEYSVTAHGKTLQKVIAELRDWGMMHRRKIIGK
ncbi:winged helix-turn-helix transcriptional regulator [Parafilimonas sp.]|uniref:winged helix-turn-helix transcriptional regulator n=1 Tax=Parafilimonas sp. TaxID=1969739 RepID=UPI003F805E54